MGLLLLSALILLSTPLGAAPQRDTIPVTAINQMVIKVSDVNRTVQWYQGLFGLPVIERTKSSAILRIGTGSRYLKIITARESKPGISEIGFAPRDIEPGAALATVTQHGAASPRRMESSIRFQDPAGIAVQLHELAELRKLKTQPNKGLLPLLDYNHFTIFVPDAKRNVQFYQQLFGLRIDTYQGPMPIIRVGHGNQFLAFVGGRTKAFVHHACFVVKNFDPDQIIKQLSNYGVKPRTNKRGPTGPLQSYVVMRMPNRGGAPEGTPELYLTDPDGILLQIQDVRYSGGGGYLGDQRGSK